MTPARSGSGCGRRRWAAGAVLLVAMTAGTAGAQPCLPSDPCVDPAVVSACEEFRTCQEDLRVAFSECVDEGCQCTEDAPNCRNPITPGRCTITLRCVRRCYGQVKDDVPSTRQCLKDLKFALREGRSCRVTSAAARRACRKAAQDTETRARCVDPIPQACFPAFEDRGSRCQHRCILRMLEALATSKDCYSRCGSRCEGVTCATSMCERACRNTVCNSLLANCVEEPVEESNAPVNRRIRDQYLDCCESEDCSVDSEETVLCTPTTSTSTSTSTSSTSTSTRSSTTSTSSTIP